MHTSATASQPQGYPVRDEDVARLSPFMRKHLNVHGTYSFDLPDMPGGQRELRDPDARDDSDDSDDSDEED